MSLDSKKFHERASAECKKKRTQILQQIEIKMVEEAANKSLSDFMYQGMDGAQGGNQPSEDLDNDLSGAESTQGDGPEKISIVRKMTKQVKSVLSEAKKTLSIADSGED